MKVYVFGGYSDDTFGEFSLTDDDYDNSASGEPIVYELKRPDGSGIVVVGQHAPFSDGWLIGCATLDESKPVDDWRIETEPSHEGYRGRMQVTAPDDTALTCISRDDPGRANRRD